jgi:hypothetical protein
VTEKGFYLELAKSRYLEPPSKREVLTDGTDELTLDTRFNKPTGDDAQYKDEGIYTITVRNPYTNRETTKKIYVGANKALKAHMKTGYSIKDIYSQIELGAEITDDGEIILPTDCVISPFELVSNNELTNKSIAESGFYLNLNESQHLDIIILKEVLSNAANGLTEDTQFNNFAKDGDKYTDEGIYTIIAINRSSEKQASMRICVGTNLILKAYINTGLSIQEINAQRALGATISKDGVIIPPPETAQIEEVVEVVTDLQNEAIQAITDNVINAEKNSFNPIIFIIVIITILLTAGSVLLLCLRRKRKSLKSNSEQRAESE